MDRGWHAFDRVVHGDPTPSVLITARTDNLAAPAAAIPGEGVHRWGRLGGSDHPANG